MLSRERILKAISYAIVLLLGILVGIVFTSLRGKDWTNFNQNISGTPIVMQGDFYPDDMAPMEGGGYAFTGGRFVYQLEMATGYFKPDDDPIRLKTPALRSTMISHAGAVFTPNDPWSPFDEENMLVLEPGKKLTLESKQGRTITSRDISKPFVVGFLFPGHDELDENAFGAGMIYCPIRIHMPER